MTHYILFYKTAENYIEKRAPYRDAHLQLAQEAHKRGNLILAGAFSEPADGAALIFKSESRAKEFAENDPYVQNGLIKSWQIRRWEVVIGGE